MNHFGRFLLMLSLAFLGGACSPSAPVAKIEGTTAKIQCTATASDSPTSIGKKVAGQIWATARQYPTVKEVEVTMVFIGKVRDQSGQVQQRRILMGMITMSDLENTRKHTSASAFASSGRTQFLGMSIQGLNGGNLLKKD